MLSSTSPSPDMTEKLLTKNIKSQVIHHPSARPTDGYDKSRIVEENPVNSHI